MVRMTQNTPNSVIRVASMIRTQWVPNQEPDVAFPVMKITNAATDTSPAQNAH